MRPSWFSLQNLSRETITRIALSWCAFLFALGAYWSHLHSSHEEQLLHAKAQTDLRAAQTAHALALQMDTLIDQVHYIATHLGEQWQREDHANFQRAIQVAQGTLPAGALLQVAIADRHGSVVFSSLSTEKTGALGVSIADREHFKVHTRGLPPRLYISHPLFGRVSQKWAVQFSLPFFHNGGLAGVTIISISPEYLSRALQELFPDPTDVALLLNDEGEYLARSHYLERVLGKSVPATRAFLDTAKGRQQGTYDAIAPIDGVLRHYAWHRTTHAPLILSLGLSEQKALAPVQASLHNSTYQNALGTGLLLLASAWITLLYLKNRQQTEALLNTSERLKLVLRGSDLGTWDWDFSANAPRFNRRWAALLGYQEAQIPVTQADWEKLVHPADLESVKAAFKNHLRGKTQQFEAEYRIRHHQGHWIWFMDRGRVVKRDAHGRAVRMAGTVLDITARKHAEAREAEYHERMTTLLQRFPGGVLMEDASEMVVMANQLFCILFDLPDTPEALSGLSHEQLLAMLGTQRAGWLHCPGSTSEQRKTIEVSTASGRTLEIDWVPIAHGQDYLGRVWLAWDISQRKEQEALLTAQAKTDALTGLLNRHSFMPYLEAMLRNESATGRDSGALLMLDVDHFKRVNDTYGHPAGDAVLQYTARVIKECLRETDTAGRLGGEEFAILLPRTNLENARILANRLREKLARTPAPTEKGDIPVTISIGLSMLAGATAKEALSRADEALYAAKAAGRNQVQTWTAQETQRLLAEPLQK